MSSRLTDFLNALRELQKINPEFPLQYAICLTVVAHNEGISLTQLSNTTGIPLSTVSRIIGTLSHKKKLSYNLIEVNISAAERRRKELYLSARGRLLVNTIAKQLSRS